MIAVWSIHSQSSEGGSSPADWVQEQPQSTLLCELKAGSFFSEEGEGHPTIWVLRGLFPPDRRAEAQRLYESMNDWPEFIARWVSAY